MPERNMNDPAVVEREYWHAVFVAHRATGSDP